MPPSLKYSREITGYGWLSPDGKFYDIQQKEEPGMEYYGFEYGNGMIIIPHPGLARILGFKDELEMEKSGWIKRTTSYNMERTRIVPPMKQPTQSQVDMIFDFCRKEGIPMPDWAKVENPGHKTNPEEIGSFVGRVYHAVRKQNYAEDILENGFSHWGDGSAGKGFYFSINKKGSNLWGKHVIEVSVKLDNVAKVSVEELSQMIDIPLRGSGLSWKESNEKQRQIVLDAGYDGLIVDDDMLVVYGEPEGRLYPLGLAKVENPRNKNPDEPSYLKPGDTFGLMDDLAIYIYDLKEHESKIHHHTLTVDAKEGELVRYDGPKGKSTYGRIIYQMTLLREGGNYPFDVFEGELRRIIENSELVE